MRFSFSDVLPATAHFLTNTLIYTAFKGGADAVVDTVASTTKLGLCLGASLASSVATYVVLGTVKYTFWAASSATAAAYHGTTRLIMGPPAPEKKFNEEWDEIKLADV